MIHEAVVRLVKIWKEKALQMESQAESETGLDRDKLLCMAQVLWGCEEDLRTGLLKHYLADAEELAPLVQGGLQDGAGSPQKSPGKDKSPSSSSTRDLKDLERFLDLPLPGEG